MMGVKDVYGGVGGIFKVEKERFDEGLMFRVVEYLVITKRSWWVKYRIRKNDGFEFTIGV